MFPLPSRFCSATLAVPCSCVLTLPCVSNGPTIVTGGPPDNPVAMATSLRNTVAARTTPKSIAKATKANGRLIVPPFLEPLYSLARLHRPGRDRGWGRTGARNGEHVDKVPIEKALVSTASLQGDSAN